MSLFCLAAVLCWPSGERQTQRSNSQPTGNQLAAGPAPTEPVVNAAASHPIALRSTMAVNQGSAAIASPRSERSNLRVRNTSQVLAELQRNEKAILLANAFIDTGKPLNLEIPEALRALPDAGTYVVQRRGENDGAFRARLQAVGAVVVPNSYIPNNAFVVRASAAAAQALGADPNIQAVMAYEPYYKLEASLLRMAVGQSAPPAGLQLRLAVYPDALPATLVDLAKLGVQVLGDEPSVLGGTLLTVKPPGSAGSVAAVARVSGVQVVEPVRARARANELVRTTLGAGLSPTNLLTYLGLTGTNVLIALADSGVDYTHPDLTNRVTGDNPVSLKDVAGHGTHVAGTIIGSGIMSSTVSNAPGAVTGANFQGVAPAGLLYSMSLNQVIGPADPLRIQSGLSLSYAGGVVSDTYLQSQAVLTNALISNNSWNYVGASTYDIESASYDAAVRDALPLVPGSQSLIFVFSAGNSGDGTDEGLQGVPDTILSPATAKNVITVGAVEQYRNLTNTFTFRTNAPGQPFLAGSDAADQVAGFSSRGNVGIGTEGTYGRFKPDVVAPGTFVISDRSALWDTNKYYFPTNDAITTYIDQGVNPGELLPYGVFIPDNAVLVSISAYSRAGVDLPIYVRQADNPTTNKYDFLGTNYVVMPPNINPLPLNTTVFYSIGNDTKEQQIFDLQVNILTTNDHPEITFFLRTNFNDAVGPYYRYESGTSMAAAGVSGLLALMEEFYQQRLQLTNSPALMKALLINGARSLGPLYDLQVQNGINFQGWGVPNISNSVPAVASNLVAGAGLATTLPLQFVDQSPTNALATGQSQTWMINLSPAGQGQDMHLTLVWTDPPGNPAAAAKLVNDLDLIVTNLETGEIFLGNDIPAGSVYSQAWDTNGLANLDVINNVENIQLASPLGSKYSITVVARRVNVNAVTANTNNIVQDFALVMSSGDAGTVSNAFTLTAVSPVQITGNMTNTLQKLTNGVALLNQRVGANSQFSGSTNGVANQWNFYVYTNTTTYPYVAFVAFTPNELGVPRIGAQGTDPYNAVRAEADLDMYVSGDPRLLTLDTNIIQAAVAAGTVSLTRSGTEKVLFSNSVPGQVYYIAIKSEDQEAGEFAFLGVASQLPFGRRDQNGNVELTPLTYLPVPVPDGSPVLPGKTNVLLISSLPDIVRRVVVTNSLVHPRAGDLLAIFSHRKKFVVLKNHTPFDNGLGAETYVYDDSGQGDIPGSRGTDGPGSLREFATDQSSDGVWILNMVDDSPTEVGSITNFQVTIQPQIPTNQPQNFVVGPHQWLYDPVTIPVRATNLTVKITNLTPGPVQVYIRRAGYPDFVNYDKTALLQPPGGTLSVTKYDSPPLNPGLYVVGVYNPDNTTAVHFTMEVDVGLDLSPVPPNRYKSVGNEVIRDDAVTYSTNYVPQSSVVVAAEVGVRISHPRESDLALTLISPSGTRVLLAENRGALDTNGYGSGLTITNTLPLQSAGGPLADTNIVPVSADGGTLIVSYDFFPVPDTMHVYYDGALIYDTGLTSYSNIFSVDFGPGVATNLTIVMNEGNNSRTGTLWEYTAQVVTRTLHYATFTEDTNYALVPIKFAIPPFAPSKLVITNFFSDFEVPLVLTNTDYSAGQTVDSWNVLANRVTLVNTNATGDPGMASTGQQSLNLRNGQIEQDLKTIGGDNYVLNFAYRRAPALTGLVSWWPAEADYVDIVSGNNGTPFGGVQFAAGEVGKAFVFDGLGSHVEVADKTNLDFAPTASMSMEMWVYNLNSQQNINLVGKRVNCDVTLINYAMACDPQNGIQFTAGIQNGAPTPTGALSKIPMPTNQWIHLAGTFDGSVFKLYTNGVLVATGSGQLGPINSAPLTIGRSGTCSAPFEGYIDELAIFNRALSAAEIKDIYLAGALGKCGMSTPPVECPACSATVSINGLPIRVITGTTNWQTNAFAFTADSRLTPLELDYTNNPSGLLLDTFVLRDFPGGPYYLPEDQLSKLVGEPSVGPWQLEIVDNRVGAANPAPSLVSWQLSLTLEDTSARAIPLTEGIPQTVLVSPNTIRYFAVPVPAWAQFATNIMSGATGPVNLLFNPGVEPTGFQFGDQSLLNNVTAGVTTFGPNGVPYAGYNLIPGSTYYLGVENQGSAPVTVTMEVDFDITTLVNGVGVTRTIPAGSAPQYFQFDVVAGGEAAAFEILNPSGDVNLVAGAGLPLPSLRAFQYDSINGVTNNEAIVVLTNSLPVPLAPGRWYLGVYNNDFQPVTYTIRATEAGTPNIISLADGVPVNFSSARGVALTNFFKFNIATETNAVVFELYNLSGNVDLDVQRGSLPYVAPFSSISANSGTNAETVGVSTNLTGGSLVGDWYLGVPNNDPVTVTYTVLAFLTTNGVATANSPFSVFAAPLLASGNTGLTLTWPTVVGLQYQVLISNDLVHWTVVKTFTANGSSISYTDPTPARTQTARYYRIARVVGP